MSSEDLKGLAAREAGDVEALLEEGGTISARARDPHFELSLIHISEPTRPY